MLERLDEIDWAEHCGAYGPATEAPDILRAMASADPQTAGQGQYDFASSLWHQGTVYPVTVVAVPFLVELATTHGVHQCEDLLHILGALCDPKQSNGADLPAVRAAATAHTGALSRTFDDPDPRVRECAAYALAHCGAHSHPVLEQGSGSVGRTRTGDSKPDTRLGGSGLSRRYRRDYIGTGSGNSAVAG